MSGDVLNQALRADAERKAAAADPVLLRHALRYALMATRAAEVADQTTAVRRMAEHAFAEARNRGITQQEVLLPDGTKAGLISITRGQTVWTVDEDLLQAIIAGNDPSDFEDVLTANAANDPRVIRLVAEHFPDLIDRRVRLSARALYQKELEENGGKVTDRMIGERVQVGTAEHKPATGAFTYRPVPKARTLLQEAVDAGLLTEDGEWQAPAEADPETSVAAVPDESAPSGPSAAAEPGDDAGERMERALSRGSRAPKHPAHEPTAEQQAVIDAVSGTPDDLVIEAGAGTGKTATLQMAAHATRARGLYLCFNKANATEAKGKFPRNVSCMTTHGLAMAAAGRPYAHRLKGGQVPAREVAAILGITMPLAVDDRIIAPQQVARLVTQTVRNFTLSGDAEIDGKHVPRKPGMDTPAAMATLRHQLLPYARKAWADLARTDGRLKFEHDTYLKIWSLSRPQLDADFVLVDEAQDTNPCVLAVLNAQDSTRRIVVGDGNQSLYEWRGSVDALASFQGKRLQLSQSFRFGSAIARAANKWLTVLDSDLRLTGYHRISSMITSLPKAHAVLCRTNATAMAEAMKMLEGGLSVAIVGGGGEIRALAEAAISLKEGRGCAHPELMAFRTWGEVQDHVENDPSGSDLQVMVKLIDDHGPEAIIACIDRLADEKTAGTVVSTGHKAKGREWDSVRIAGDFHPPKLDPEHPEIDPGIPADQARLAYVAVTRARLSLDNAGLAWVDRFLPGGAV